MQKSLDEFISENPSENGYFTVVQYDDGPLLNLPPNTTVYGACSGNIQLPLIYEDKNQTLKIVGEQKAKSFQEKKILCSFVGTITHFVREASLGFLRTQPGFEIYVRNGWSTNVEQNLQELFIEKTLDSKYALAPRGYGRSSFRFFEIFHLGSIPIYIWDDIEWLPYKDKINYSKFCISIHISQVDQLPQILREIKEEKYNEMLQEYQKIKHVFTLEFMCQYIIQKK
jgi:hypothetical protein